MGDGINTARYDTSFLLYLVEARHENLWRLLKYRCHFGYHKTLAFQKSGRLTTAERSVMTAPTDKKLKIGTKKGNGKDGSTKVKKNTVLWLGKIKSFKIVVHDVLVSTERVRGYRHKDVLFSGNIPCDTLNDEVKSFAVLLRGP
jgi:hypothetical protein